MFSVCEKFLQADFSHLRKVLQTQQSGKTKNFMFF